ncbi:arsenate reductase (glutaredoxin) [uncultured Abyssibacter sp.]|uniref:arsenate reductase (glutaredoxin) n=1 Tax=uncultured Abyssibacter sp. TaxID=2320202 RepID=UPI0032B2BB36
MSLTIFHNPRCSKSRQTLARIEDAAAEHDVVLYLETPPDAVTLKGMVDKLGLPVTDIIRFKEALAKELGISAGDDRPEAEWIELLVAHPKLLERPIVVAGDRAVIGRPPENVDALL